MLLRGVIDPTNVEAVGSVIGRGTFDQYSPARLGQASIVVAKVIVASVFMANPLACVSYTV